MSRLVLALSMVAVLVAGQGQGQGQGHDHPMPEKLGTVSFPVSCNPEAQADFNRAVALLHSFTYKPAEAAFQHVAQKDPACAMAHWGIAMTHYHQLWDLPPSPADTAAGEKEIRQAGMMERTSEREREFVHAIGLAFQDAATVPYSVRAVKYEAAMRQLAMAYPNDGMFSIPVVNITGQSGGFGVSGANTNYVQRNFHYRDNIFVTHGFHTVKAGLDGWKGYDIANFQGLNSQPVFAYNNLIDFVNDAPHQESGLSYNPLSGQPKLANIGYGSATYGAFVEDTWRARRNLVINYGVRWDNFGNPYPLEGTGFANFYLGAGSTIQQQVANGNMVQTPHFFAHSISNVWSPRAGFSWDPISNGRFIVKGGFGVYRDWPTLGISDSRLKANPPSYITPTFLAGTTTAPVLSVGTSNVFPYGFTYPSLPARSLDAHGGLTGLQIQVGGIDPAIKSTNTYIYSASVDTQLPLKLVGSVGYSGSHSDNLLTDSGAQTTVNWGDDVNRFPGDLIVNNNVLTRLNPSFGALYYIRNIARSNYDALLLSVRGRFNKNGFISASYTYSQSKDNSQVYPDPFEIDKFYGPSVWDTPQRLSLLINYEIPGSRGDNRFLNLVTRGFSLSNTTILQSGTPFVVSTSASFQPTRNASGVITGLTAASGDYNADGRNYDFPNVSSYTYATDRASYLGRNNPTGIFGTGQFTQPTIGGAGNELPYQFRNPGYADTDLGVRKNNTLYEGISLQLRADIFNLFNRPNLGAVTSDLSSGSFGKSTSQINARYVQLGVAVNF